MYASLRISTWLAFFRSVPEPSGSPYSMISIGISLAKPQRKAEKSPTMARSLLALNSTVELLSSFMPPSVGGVAPQAKSGYLRALLVVSSATAVRMVLPMMMPVGLSIFPRASSMLASAAELS